jgi:hypothetical protein
MTGISFYPQISQMTADFLYDNNAPRSRASAGELFSRGGAETQRKTL